MTVLTIILVLVISMPLLIVALAPLYDKLNPPPEKKVKKKKLKESIKKRIAK